MRIYLEPSDVARELGVTPATVKLDALAGKLKVAALTKRGSRLFRQKDVEEYIRYREEASAKRERKRLQTVQRTMASSA